MIEKLYSIVRYIDEQEQVSRFTCYDATQFT